MPKAPPPKGAMFRYRSRICCLVSCFSRASAYRISRILRPGVSDVASTTSCGELAEYSMACRTYCMVSVEAPCAVSPEDWLATNARATPFASTPWCS